MAWAAVNEHHVRGGSVFAPHLCVIEQKTAVTARGPSARRGGGKKEAVVFFFLGGGGAVAVPLSLSL